MRAYVETECGACSRSAVSGGCSACRKLESSQMRVSKNCWGKQYSSRRGSAGRSRVEEAGGEERRDESVAC